MSDDLSRLMKASAEGAKAKTDWLTAHDNWLKLLNRKVVRLQWQVFLLEVWAVVLLAREIGFLG